MLNYIRAHSYPEAVVNQHRPQTRQLLCPSFHKPIFKHHLLWFVITLNPPGITMSYVVPVHFCLPKGSLSDRADFDQAYLQELYLLLEASIYNRKALPLKPTKIKLTLSILF